MKIKDGSIIVVFTYLWDNKIFVFTDMYRLKFQNKIKDITPYTLFNICMKFKNNF